MKTMIDLLLHEPPLYNAVIARRVGCERRRVRRYRRLLATSGLTATHLEGLDGPTLRALLFPRPRRHARPDYGALAVAHPGSSCLFQYARYCETAAATGDSAMGYSLFNRGRRDHEFHQRRIRLLGWIASPMHGAEAMECRHEQRL